MINDQGALTTLGAQRVDMPAPMLACARRSFFEYGYQHTTMRALAAALELPQSMLYDYVASKPQLLASVLHDTVTHFTAQYIPPTAQTLATVLDHERRLAYRPLLASPLGTDAIMQTPPFITYIQQYQSDWIQVIDVYLHTLNRARPIHFNKTVLAWIATAMTRHRDLHVTLDVDALLAFIRAGYELLPQVVK